MLLEIESCLAELRSSQKAKVKTVVAKELLGKEITVQIGGVERFLRLKNLGLGMYEVTLADENANKRNLIIKGTKR